ncbi:FliH/SctL family protein [Agromyces mediolanus]|uniref:FliH/SctL family protein n=1 Tax=Agromyces mediolanus TaxID=41986 RepID=UPI00383658F2
MSSSRDAAFGTIDFPRIGRPGEADAAAEERGFARGLADARRRTEAERERLLTALAAEAAEREARRAAEHRAAIEALVIARTAIGAAALPVLAEAERQLAAGALALAETLLGAELAADPDGAARAALRRALDHDDAALVVRVRMHPAALARVAAAAPEGVELLADASLAPGNAVAELPDGLVDARISTAIDRVRRSLEEAP